MAILVKGIDGREYEFDNFQGELVTRLLNKIRSLVEDNGQLEVSVFTLEAKNMVLEEKLKLARENANRERREADEVINKHIAYLDPDHRS